MRCRGKGSVEIPWTSGPTVGAGAREKAKRREKRVWEALGDKSLTI